MKYTESELIIALKNKDNIAFKFFVNGIKDKAYSLLVGILKNKTTAEDALQDAFVKFYFSISTFREESKLNTWFYSIVFNTGLTYAKKRGAIFKTEIEVSEDLSIDTKTPIEELIENEQSSNLIDSINKLSYDYATVLNLFYFEELSVDEISKITGFSNTKIKTSLHRARQKLKINYANSLEEL